MKRPVYDSQCEVQRVAIYINIYANMRPSYSAPFKFRPFADRYEHLIPAPKGIFFIYKTNRLM
jgi:hypothetical protein